MTITAINPTTGQILDTWSWMTSSEIEAILDLAQSTFQAHRLDAMRQRSQWLMCLADDFDAHLDAWATLITTTMGKPIELSKREVSKCADACRHFASSGVALLAPQIVETHLKKSSVHHLPLGPILAIMPWNYPLWQVIRLLAPNIMLGNTFVLAHAPIVTAVGIRLQQTFERLGCPVGLFQVIWTSHEDMATIIQDRRIAGVSFTGSDRVGGTVAALAGKALKPTVIECGGSDPYVVLADADVAHAASVCVAMRLTNSGQVCISAKRIIVDRSIHQDFLDAVVAQVAQYTMGDPMSPLTQLGPMARCDLRAYVHQQVQQSVRDGACCVQGGVMPQGEGFYYPATILTGVQSGMAAFNEEVFGPVVALIEASDEAHAIDLANDSMYGLGAAIFTQDVARAERLAIEQLQAGCCMVNGGVSSDVRLPFGGIKQSGYGRELGMPSVQSFANVKTIGVHDTSALS